ncbi:hypothetical protein ATY41_10115 [Leifsonia xyli subsp. xyli]|uniref:Glutamine amidotransferase domain-containing protein n=2 Tax=Leifsonia xyli subsp. xyli TaxID=59736 RepID=Q6AHB0_LEIXX|nr:hypothetical protein [Leifsonia xyli]AAT88235.1 conserved hypothetical protein [Leifsonia xyli subsp. xyli str. CTCB07]ODA90334.1 hypothetical protein ATY41_10115 [Leifsonia xyli subsp. xyli]
MTKTALILQHSPSIHLGNIGPVLTEHGYDLCVIDATRTDVAAIDPTEADLVVVLGGEKAAYQSEEFPFLAAEQPLLRVAGRDLTQNDERHTAIAHIAMAVV